MRPQAALPHARGAALPLAWACTFAPINDSAHVPSRPALPCADPPRWAKRGGGKKGKDGEEGGGGDDGDGGGAAGGGGLAGYSEQTRISLANIDEGLVNTDLIEALVASHLSGRQQGGGGRGGDDASAILIFAPGRPGCVRRRDAGAMLGWASRACACVCSAALLPPRATHRSLCTIKRVCALPSPSFSQARTRSAASAASCPAAGAWRRRPAAAACRCCRCTAACRPASSRACSTARPRVGLEGVGGRAGGRTPAACALPGTALQPAAAAAAGRPGWQPKRFLAAPAAGRHPQAWSRSWSRPTWPRRRSPSTTSRA